MKLDETRPLKDLKTGELFNPTDGSMSPELALQMTGTKGDNKIPAFEPNSAQILPSGEGQAQEDGSEAANLSPISPIGHDSISDNCSEHICPNGHTWPPKIGLVQCEGCKRMIMGIMFSNCPICNEPIAQTRLRVDYSTERIGFPSRCKGVHNEAESHFLTLQREQKEPKA